MPEFFLWVFLYGEVDSYSLDGKIVWERRMATRFFETEAHCKKAAYDRDALALSMPTMTDCVRLKFYGPPLTTKEKG